MIKVGFGQLFSCLYGLYSLSLSIVKKIRDMDSSIFTFDHHLDTLPVSECITYYCQFGLHRAFYAYSYRINRMPNKYNSTNAGNKYTPIGRVMAKNESYTKQLTAWKKEHLFPYFLNLGYTLPELNEAWKLFKVKYK
jgi:hypothetical protein